MSLVFYVSKQLWRKDRGDEVSCSEHCRTVGSWPLQCLPWGGPLSVRNLAEMAEIRSVSHFSTFPGSTWEFTELF